MRLPHLLAALGAVTLALSASAPAPAQGSPSSQVATVGAPAFGAVAAGAGVGGYCRDDSGVTVVVDFQQLGGGVVVRCAPGPLSSGATGLDALEGAGFTPTGTTRWGLAFICRINNKPSASQDLTIPGNDHYREPCVDTPPLSANWGYWYARNNGEWTYSSTGAASRQVIHGGFEGWSFSLGHADGDNPPPRVAPSHPVAEPPATSPAPTTSPPTSKPPDRPRPTHTAPAPSSPTTSSPRPDPTSSSPTRRPTTSTSSTASSGPKHRPEHREKPRRSKAGQPSTTTPPAVTSAPTTGTVQVSTELPAATSDTDDPGSSRSTWIGLGVLLVIATGAGVTAWRRSRRT